jgi:hypothetical protein
VTAYTPGNNCRTCGAPITLDWQPTHTAWHLGVDAAAALGLPAAATVGPDDRLVLRFDQALTSEQVELLDALVARTGLSRRVLVLGPEAYLAVVTADPQPATAGSGTIGA